MNNTSRPDFCFSAAVLSGVDAIDIAECFGLAAVCVDDGEGNLFDDELNCDEVSVFRSSVDDVGTVASRRK